MPSLNSLFLLSLLPLSFAFPTHRSPTHKKRDVPSVVDAVLAFGTTTSSASNTGNFAVGEPLSANDDTTSPADALVLAEGDGNGHWVTYTTSSWVKDSPAPTSAASSSAVSSSDVNPISTFVSQGADAAISVSACIGSDCGASTSAVTTSSSDSEALPSSTIDSASVTSTSESVDTLSMTGDSATPPVSTTATSSSTQPSGTYGNGTVRGGGNGTSSGGSSGGGTYDSAKHVFAHFMVGIISTYQTSDWVNDMQLAKSKGITGFALNIGVDPYSQSQLDLAYDAAASVGDFNVFISFDFNWYTVSNVSGVADMMKRYVDKPAQLLVDGKPFVSSFIGDGFDWASVATQVGRPIFAMPFFQPTADNVNNPGVSGLFSWAAWPGQLDNQPVLAAMTCDRDELYMSQLKTAGKQYMAPISPWFFTHFGTEVSYSKNWLFYSEDLWKTRWDQILQLGQQGVNFVEIVTWNDYGEAHHIGPFDTPHTDDGSSKWAKGLDHSAMLDFSVPYIEAFKQGKSEPVIDKEILVYWHRPHIKDVSCDGTDNCGKKPDGWDYVEDVLFVATMSRSGATVTVNSGGNAPVTKTVDAGVQLFKVPMGVGQQSFDFKSNAGVSAQGTSNVSVIDTCWNGIYNYNFHSGVVG